MERIIKEIRYISKYENKSLPVKIVKFNEEFGEFCTEVIKYLGFSYKPYDRAHLIEEAADSLQVLLSIFVQLENEADIKVDEILSTIPEKNKKWLEKISSYTQTIELPDQSISTLIPRPLLKVEQFEEEIRLTTFVNTSNVDIVSISSSNQIYTLFYYDK